MNNFSCPKCKTKQSLKHLYLMSKYSTWECDSCTVVLKPKDITGMSNYISMYTTIFFGYILLFVFKVHFLKTMLLLVLLGCFIYLGSLVYFYKTTYLEEV